MREGCSLLFVTIIIKEYFIFQVLIFAEKLKFWKVKSEGGDKFAFEQPPTSSDIVPAEAELENDLENACFATSFHSCSKQQVIELKLLPQVIDEYKPYITFTDW